jgi:pimeloyl-ACP methyl ester carboxylesterase
MAYAREMRCELLTTDEYYFPVVERELVCLPNVKHIEIPEAGHSMHSANPVLYNKEVLAFLANY